MTNGVAMMTMRSLAGGNGRGSRWSVAAFIAAAALAVSISLVLHSPVAAASKLESMMMSINKPLHESAFQFDSSLTDIQWATDQIVFMLSVEGKVYRSRNHGRSWEEQSANMRSAGVRIHSMRMSRADKRYIFFIGERDHHFATDDFGDNYYRVDFPLSEIRLNPLDAKWLLGSSMTPGCGRPVHQTDPKDENVAEKMKTTCFKQLHYSEDFGKSWKHMHDYVAQYDWAPSIVGPRGEKQPNHVVFATVHSESDSIGNQVFGRWSKEINFVVSLDLFKSKPTVLVPHGNRFLFGEHNYLFVAAVDPDHETAVQLMVSKTNSLTKTFEPAILEADLTEHSYTILDTSEDVVFLHVNHKPLHESAQTGHLYTSDSTGTQFSLSLPFNHRNEAGKCDFAKVEALEGVFLANFVDEISMAQNHEEETSEMSVDETAKGSGGAHRGKSLHIKTVITYNKGGEWSYLAKPALDVAGNNYACEQCHLHLHGVTNTFGPFYSVSAAPGLILATGSIGHNLNSAPSSVNTYFSRDGGVVWEEVALGSHIYDISNHGGLVVMVKDQVATNKLLYSYNQGKSWHEYTFTDKAFVVENVVTDPASISQAFIVYGADESGGHGMAVYVDFTVVHQRPCQGLDAPGTQFSDYELWNPSDGRPGGHCLMGHTTTYVRRKQASECYIPDNVPAPRIVSHCQCTVHDYECDAGYIRAKDTGLCERDPHSDVANKVSAADAHSNCAHQSHYRVSKGYRKVPGNTCIGGHDWEAIVAPCPSGWLAASHAPAMLVLLIVIIAIGFMFLSQFKVVDQFIQNMKGRFDFAHGYFKINGSGRNGSGNGGTPHSMAEDDLDLNDSEVETGGSGNSRSGGSSSSSSNSNNNRHIPLATSDKDELSLSDSGSDVGAAASKPARTIPAFMPLPNGSVNSTNTGITIIAPPVLEPPPAQ